MRLFGKVVVLWLAYDYYYSKYLPNSSEPRGPGWGFHVLHATTSLAGAFLPDARQQRRSNGTELRGSSTLLLASGPPLLIADGAQGTINPTQQ